MDSRWTPSGLLIQFQEFIWTPDGVHQDSWLSVMTSVSAPHLRGPLSFPMTSTTTTPAHMDPRSPVQPPSSSYRTTRYGVSATHHHHLLIPHPEPMSNKWLTTRHWVDTAYHSLPPFVTPEADPI